ncbi:hypothetical protein SAMN05216464_111146 [Mucilaginibacter pineti]|uniref:Uncharacterized protein n=1 Tax=Mucilaginibacter pineti TaxID=1391627 RepID=A0A1G7HAW8_9SPHI|nr:hypothetical protein SAMN05216464_111146 [Mucilaginibacter pineti]
MIALELSYYFPPVKKIIMIGLWSSTTDRRDPKWQPRLAKRLNHANAKGAPNRSTNPLKQLPDPLSYRIVKI